MLVRSLAQGFAFQGEPNPLKKGAHRGQPSGHLPPTAFVAFAQNHDQIGNRPLGDPLTTQIGPEGLAFARFVTLLSPSVPLMFMGEEWATRRPFPFFCDFEGDLAEAVRQGRKREFGDFPGFHGEIPDALLRETFESAKRDWAEPKTPAGSAALAETRHLIAIRRDRVVPLLKTAFLSADDAIAGTAARVSWRFEGGNMTMLLNPSPHSAFIPTDADTEGHPVGPSVARCGSVAATEGGYRLDRWSAAAWITP